MDQDDKIVLLLYIILAVLVAQFALNMYENSHGKKVYVDKQEEIRRNLKYYGYQ